MNEEITIEQEPEVTESETMETVSAPKITGQQIAYIFANLFAPAPAEPGKELTPEQARQAFIADYTAITGTVLDLIGFAEAAERFNAPDLIPSWLKVVLGVGTMVIAGVALRRKYFSNVVTRAPDIDQNET